MGFLTLTNQLYTDIFKYLQCYDNNSIIICMKSILDSDWLTAVQLLYNSVQTCVIPCNYNYKKIQSDWPRNIAIQNKLVMCNKKVA